MSIDEANLDFLAVMSDAFCECEAPVNGAEFWDLYCMGGEL